ncbi:MAG: M43 family zinc metalloprotease, partial [Ginsengibacter sp.]
SLTIVFYTSGQRCGTPEYVQNHPVNKYISQRTVSQKVASRDTLKDEVIIIPVVVHVLYNTPDQNISDAQIISQINSLNNDYRRLNADAVNTPAPFQNVAADVRIQFCLAKVDPNGYATSGIVRKYTKQKDFLNDDAVKFSSTGGDDAWDATKYLNLWVCNLFNLTLGYGVLPGSPLEKDGVVIKYNVFGTVGNVVAPYNKGRTATHEIGHWLGLKHLWGDSFCGDDSIADTPPQQAGNYGCSSFPHLSQCSVNSYGDMFMNYMDFSDDACMNMFTLGQKTKMRSLFALGGPRNSFLNSIVCDSSNAEAGPLPKPVDSELKITIYPNPFNNVIHVTTNQDKDVVGKVLKLYSITGKLYLTQTIETSNTIIKVNNLSSGMYILKIQGKNEEHVSKVIKQAGGLSN